MNFWKSVLSVLLAIGNIASPAAAQGPCAHVSGEGQIHNTCKDTITVVIERRFVVGEGMHSVEQSEIVRKRLGPGEIWRPPGSGFVFIREEKE